MSAYTFISHQISFATLRDYIMSHKINAGDSIVLNPHDFEHLIQEIKASSEGIPDIPLTLLGVLITQDSTDGVPIGKVQIVNSDKPY